MHVYVYVVCGRGCTCLCKSASSYHSLLCCVYIHLPVRCIKRCAQVHSTHPYSHMWNPEVLITLHFNFWSLIEPGAHLFSQTGWSAGTSRQNLPVSTCSPGITDPGYHTLIIHSAISPKPAVIDFEIKQASNNNKNTTLWPGRYLDI